MTPLRPRPWPTNWRERWRRAEKEEHSTNDSGPAENSTLRNMATQIDTSEMELFADARAGECYQCGKCSAGCPMADHMDLLPNQLVRLVQLGRLERGLRSEAIWKCVSCHTCSARCPKSVDCAGIIDALRQQAVATGTVAPSRRRTLLFQQTLLENIRRNGRIRELEMVGTFKTKAFLTDGNVPLLFKDAWLPPKLLARGKFHFRGERVTDRAVVRRIFERCQPPAADTPTTLGAVQY